MKTNLQAKLKPRRERRLDAKNNGTTFEPYYTEGKRIGDFGCEIKVGGKPRPYAEVYGRKQGEPKPKKTKEATQ